MLPNKFLHLLVHGELSIVDFDLILIDEVTAISPEAVINQIFTEFYYNHEGPKGKLPKTIGFISFDIFLNSEKDLAYKRIQMYCNMLNSQLMTLAEDEVT